MKHRRQQHSGREQQAGNPPHGHSTLSMISGMSLGAAVMYALDPDRGHRRRAMARQRLVRLLRLAGESMDKGIRDLEHRAEGIIAEPGSVLHGSVRSGSRPELAQQNWAPGMRLIMGGLGAAVFLRGLRQPGIINSFAALLGLALVARCARGTRIADEVLEAMRPSPGPRSGNRHPAEQPAQTEPVKSMPA